jgi:hypothetical protein
MTRWLRDPLLQCLVLGAVLYGGVQLWSRIHPEAAALVKPTDADANWLQDEVLYRDGLALQLDRDDAVMRERVIARRRALLDAQIRLQQPTAVQLQDWFSAHRDRYDSPLRVDWQQATPAAPSTEVAARQLAQRLAAGQPVGLEVDLQVKRNQPLQQLTAAQGEAFATRLQSLMPGRWSALQGVAGWNAVRLNAVLPAHRPDYEEVAEAVRRDWLDEQTRQQREQLLGPLLQRYRLRD